MTVLIVKRRRDSALLLLVEKRISTTVTFPAAAKSMAKLLTYELTYVGTAVNGLSFATGYSVFHCFHMP